MFNLFKKKDQSPSISQHFSDLTHNQRMSVINLFSLIAFGDGEGTRKETALLNTWLQELGVNHETAHDYIQETGYETMISDLNGLSREQKRWLVLGSNDLIASDGEISQDEVAQIADYFGDLGIDMDEYINIVAESKR